MIVYDNPDDKKGSTGETQELNHYQ